MDVTRGDEPTPARPEWPGQPVPVPEPNPVPATRRRRRGIFWLAGLVVLAGAAVAGWLILQDRADEHNAAAPVEAVRTYVDAIARGDATTANDLVDPSTFADDVDPALLTDKMLDSADERITILDVARGDASSGDESSETVEVVVTFRIMAEKLSGDPDSRDLPRGPVDDSVTLRATRTDSDLFGFETWEVRDPFLVPVTIMAGGAPAETGTFGSESVPLNDLRARKEPQRVFVYPALYPLRGPEVSQHLEQWPGRQFLEAFDGARPAADSEPTPAALIYTTTDKLRDMVSAKVAEHVQTCLTASPFPPDCPTPLESSDSTTVRVTEAPTVGDILQDTTKPYAKGKPIVFGFVANGKVSLTNLAFPEGLDLPLILVGQVTIKTDDTVAITFSEELV